MFSLTPWKKNDGQSRELAPRTEHPVSRLRDEFDALFDRMLGGWPGPLFGATDWSAGWGLDLDDTGQEVVVRADAPGFEADDFEVQVSGQVLTIRAERKQGEENGGNFSHRRLDRSVTLPAGVDADRVEARYRNGVLELRLPKTPDAQAKRIEVKS